MAGPPPLLFGSMLMLFRPFLPPQVVRIDERVDVVSALVLLEVPLSVPWNGPDVAGPKEMENVACPSPRCHP